MWTGNCNRCGKCCTRNFLVPGIGELEAMCEHLIIDGDLGAPESTRCGRYETRYQGMPIVLRATIGNYRIASTCDMMFPNAQQGVPVECSYCWEGPGDPPEYQHLVELKR